MLNRKCTLVLASGPDAPGWVERFYSYVKGLNWTICVINNAWKLIPVNEVHTWFASNDFHVVAQLQPNEAEQRVLDTKKCTAFSSYPFTYDFNKSSGTMIMNTLIHILNVGLAHSDTSPVCVVGSNLIYKEGATHFYGNSTLDPLRNGEDWLNRELFRVNALYGIAGRPLYNLSEEQETRLPFQRHKLSLWSAYGVKVS